jgi:TPR repeat protein
MKKHVVIAATILAVVAASQAYAMTNTQARQLGDAAYKGNTAALTKLEAAANGNDTKAQTWLGGYFVLKSDYTKAIYWFQKAAAQGYAVAETSLGLSYNYGQGVPQNYAKAIYWFQKAAAQGYARAEYSLGFAYYNGHGIPQNTTTAIYWLKKAAAQGGRTGATAWHLIYFIEHG